MHRGSEHAGLWIRDGLGDVEDFVQGSRYAGCCDFGVQETRNVLFQKSKDVCAVWFWGQEMSDILLGRWEGVEGLVFDFDPENAPYLWLVILKFV